MIGYGSLHRGMLTLATVSWHSLPNEIWKPIVVESHDSEPFFNGGDKQQCSNLGRSS